MSKTAAELLLEMDAKATKGPLRAEYDSCDCGDGYPCGHGDWVHRLRGPDEPVSTGGFVRGWAEFSELAPDTVEAFITLRNALPKLAAVCEAAVALRSIGAPPYGAYLSWQRSGDSRSAQALESFDDVVAAARTAFDAALADLTAALGEKP